MYNPEYTLTFPFLGTNFCVLRADMEQLWEEMVQEEATKDSTNKTTSTLQADNTTTINSDNDERLPYWAELWPSSLALAKWLFENSNIIQEKNCLDLGCGLGFTAICGAWRGAHVLGVDYEPRAILLAKENALANKTLLRKKIPLLLYQLIQKKNTVCLEHIKTKMYKKSLSFIKKRNTVFDNLDFKVMDWRTPFTEQKSFDFIWAADIIYERAFALPVLEFLDYALSEKGKVWIAEPGRAIFEVFKKLLLHESEEKTLAIPQIKINKGNDFSKPLPKIYSQKFTLKKVHFEKTHSLSAHIPSANVTIWELARR